MNQKDTFLATSHGDGSIRNGTGLRVLQLESAASAVSPRAASDAAAAAAMCESPSLNSDNTGSYVQVIVQKHHRGRPTQYTEGERVARASSPIPERTYRDVATRTDAVRHPALSCVKLGVQNPCPNNTEIMRAAGDARVLTASNNAYVTVNDENEGKKNSPNNQKVPTLKELECHTCNFDLEDNGPECLAVYYFERGNGEFLCGVGSTHRPLPAVERAVRRAAHQASWLIAEVLAVPRLAVSLTLYSVIEFERWSLTTVRGVLCGAVQTAGDFFLKPALAITFNALVRPPLVFLANVTTAVRDALRPFWQALGDAMEPPARLLGAIRLVQVNVQSPTPSVSQFTQV